LSPKSSRRAPTELGKGKLKEEHKLFIMKCLGEYIGAGEIVEIIKDKYKIKVTPQLINQYKTTEKWMPVIQKFRDKYESKISDVPGSSKRYRMERMERLARRAEENEENGALIAATRHQQIEIEGSGNQGGSSVHNTLIFNQYNHMTDDEIEKRKNQLLNFLKSKEGTIEGEIANVA
jgi:hypothetical protein